MISLMHFHISLHNRIPRVVENRDLAISGVTEMGNFAWRTRKIESNPRKIVFGSSSGRGLGEKKLEV